MFIPRHRVSNNSIFSRASETKSQCSTSIKVLEPKACDYKMNLKKETNIILKSLNSYRSISSHFSNQSNNRIKEIAFNTRN